MHMSKNRVRSCRDRARTPVDLRAQERPRDPPVREDRQTSQEARPRSWFVTWKSSDTNVERQADLSLPYRPKSPVDDFRTNRTTLSDRADFVAKHSPAFRHPLLSKQKQQQQHQKDDTNASIPKTF